MRKIILCFSLLSFITCYNAIASGEDSTKKSSSLPAIQVKDLNGQSINFADFAANGQITVVSFFATWCKPCVEELPYFLQEFSTHKNDSLQLLMVSLDFKDFYPQKILSFAKKRKIIAPIVWLDETNADVFCPKIDSAWSGAIPASLFINSRKGFKSFYDGQISHEQLKIKIKALLK